MRKVIVRKLHRGDDENAIDRAFWKSVDPNERVAFTWTLFEQWLEIRGFDAGQLRLDRSVARVERRAGALFDRGGARARVYRALAAFGAPLDALAESELIGPDLIFQIGVAPLRIDVMTSIDGVAFTDAWEARVAGTFGGQPVFYIGREEFIRNKRACGRHRDFADLELLD